METRDLLRTEITPAIFDGADRAFPELRFTRNGKNWHSPLKLDGTAPKTPRNDQTIITARLPYRFIEQGGNHVSFCDYVAERDHLTQFLDVIERLATLAGISLPSLDPEDWKLMDKQRRAANLWADVADYCQKCLWDASDPEAKVALDYLARRGYKPEHIEVMWLGFLPSRALLFEYLLTGKRYGKSEIDELKDQLEIGLDGKRLSSSWGIGETHKLIIPHVASGRIIGIVGRTLGDEKTKYLYPLGEDWRRPALFNLFAIKGEKDLVIMEGFLDALGASFIAKIPDVVALGDNSGLNKERIEDAKYWGARKITLCFDNNEGGRIETENALQALKEHAPDLPVYVALLPMGQDPDDLLKAEGPEALKNIIKGAVHYWEYLGNNVINEYKHGPGKYETLKKVDEIVEELTRIAADITNPTEQEEANTLFIEALSPYGITRESFQEATEAISEKVRLEKQGWELQDERGSREIPAGGADYSELLKTVKESDIQDSIKQQPESLKSGYKIGGDELLFPAGALSILAGPTSHGKTALLLNVLLNASAAYPEKKFYLFSYEESREAVLIKALSSYAGIELSKDNKGTIRSYYRGEDFFKNGSDKAGFLEKTGVFFRDLIEPGRVTIHYADYTAPELVEAIRYLKEHGGAGAVFIDYKERLQKPDAGNSRQEELKEICLDLKDIAVETGLPIVLAAQFNRTVESPLDLRATNIGEAGDIEQASNLVLGIWKGDIRPIVDRVDKAELEKLGFDSETLLNKGKLYVKILKNRDGEAGGTGWLDYNGNTGKMKNSEAPDSF